jgi:hypothetical protein
MVIVSIRGDPIVTSAHYKAPVAGGGRPVTGRSDCETCQGALVPCRICRWRGECGSAASVGRLGRLACPRERR